MKVKHLGLSGFTVFENAAFDFCPGINVLMGENGTGKSHVLRALYAFSHDGPEMPARRLLGALQVRRNDELRRGRQPCKLTFQTDLHEKQSTLLFNEDEYWLGHFGPPPNRVVLIPANETLSLFPGFEGLYSLREFELPSTVVDLQQQLRIPRLRDPKFADVSERLMTILGGRIKLERDRFVLEGEETRTTAPMMAEGHRKLGMLSVLLENGVLGPKTLLLWDEPEANLHPALTEVVVDAIVDLARHGSQVVLATHSYLVSQLLSRSAEDHPGAPPIRFFSLRKPTPKSGVEVETGDVLADIRHDAILDAFSRYDAQEMERAVRRISEPSKAGPKKKKARRKA